MPRKRSYESYVENANEAITLNKPCNGVKGLWKFHKLPYAPYIARTVDAMHAHNNVICDIIATMRPTNSGDSLLFKHKNRTYNEKVNQACSDEGIYFLLQIRNY